VAVETVHTAAAVADAVMPRGRVAAAAAAAPVSVAVAGAAAGVPQVKGLAGSAAPDVLGYFKRLYGLQF
jgi:hypothetical protein